jgi:nucleotide-binding universal stress UspA family protein
MNGTIICTVDDSDGVEAAIEVSRRLAGRFDARILLVAVVDGFAAGTEVGESLWARQVCAGAKRRLERIAAEHDLSREELRVAAGDPAEAVAVIAAEEAADLIVVGARRGLLGRTLRSSLARELAATASCPVVVAPPEVADASPAARRSPAGSAR